MIACYETGSSSIVLFQLKKPIILEASSVSIIKYM